MAGNKALLDTNVIIFASKQKIDMSSLLEKYDDFYVSVITFMEVYGYEFENEQEKELIDELFEGLEIVEISREIAEQAIIYRKNKTKKIKLPDAIILATAKYLGADLITDDWDDFMNIDTQVNVQNIDKLKSRS
jgi:predicted nucleic acid-binding protein